MTDATQPALVLDTDVAQSEQVHFAGFPGLWLTGRPIAVSELGLGDTDEVYALVEELGLPLAQTTVAPGDGLMPVVDNHVRAGETPVYERAELVDVTEGEPPADPFADAVAVNADALIASLATVDDVAQLDGFEQAEQAARARKTVLEAIAERRTELASGGGTSDAGEAGS